MKTRYILLLSAAILAAGAMISCHKDNPEEHPSSGKLEGIDDLVYFRSVIAWKDSLDTIHYNYGDVLNANEPRHLYVGADTYEEAEEMFLGWVAPKGDVKTADGQVQYHMTDADGKSQGTVTLSRSGDSARVAEVTASAGVDLGVFDRITFQKKSLWPGLTGEESKYQLGDLVNIPVSGLGTYKGVCIREKAPGVSGLAVALSRYEFHGGVDLEDGSIGMMVRTLFVKYNKDWVNSACPNKSEAVDIAKILSRDWDFFEACFDDAGEGQLHKGANYWTEEWDYRGVYDQRWAMVLSTPNNDGLEWFDVTYAKTFKRVIFRMTF